jgi:hypothetical protein
MRDKMEAATKYIAYVPLGDAMPTDANPRAVDLPRLQEGVFDFNDLVDGPLDTLYEHGFRRFLIWNAFGLDYPIKQWSCTLNGIATKLSTNQSVDAYLNLIDLNFPPYRMMAQTFEPAIKRFKKAHHEVDIIAYVGTAMGNPHFNGLSDSQITARLKASLAPYVNTGCHMAFDTACVIPPDHWLAKYYQTIEAAGLKIYVEAAPWRYDYLKSKGFVSALEQLKNVNSISTQPQTPTVANGGYNGFLDPSLVMGERVGALFGSPPKKFTGWLDWFRRIVPRAFNAKQIDSVALHMNPFVGPPYATELITLNDVVSQLEQTNESNYSAYLSSDTN